MNNSEKSLLELVNEIDVNTTEMVGTCESLSNLLDTLSNVSYKVLVKAKADLSASSHNIVSSSSSYAPKAMFAIGPEGQFAYSINSRSIQIPKAGEYTITIFIDSLHYLFYNMSRITEVLFVDNSQGTSSRDWLRGTYITKIANVTNKGELDLYGASKLQRIENLQITGVSQLNSLFTSINDRKNISYIDISIPDTTKLNSTFASLTNLNTLIIRDTEKLIDITSMCSGCTLLNKIPEMDMTNIVTTKTAFNNCIGLTEEVDANKFWENPSITNYTGTFKGCTNLKNYDSIPEGWRS